jgi:hypothetical protein
VTFLQLLCKSETFPRSKRRGTPENTGSLESPVMLVEGAWQKGNVLALDLSPGT